MFNLIEDEAKYLILKNHDAVFDMPSYNGFCPFTQDCFLNFASLCFWQIAEHEMAWQLKPG